MSRFIVIKAVKPDTICKQITFLHIRRELASRSASDWTLVLVLVLSLSVGVTLME